MSLCHFSIPPAPIATPLTAARIGALAAIHRSMEAAVADMPVLDPAHAVLIKTSWQPYFVTGNDDDEYEWDKAPRKPPTGAGHLPQPATAAARVIKLVSYHHLRRPTSKAYSVNGSSVDLVMAAQLVKSSADRTMIKMGKQLHRRHLCCPVSSLLEDGFTTAAASSFGFSQSACPVNLTR